MSKARKTRPEVQKHHYAVLGVTKDTPMDALRQAYLLLAKELHPDRNGGTAEANDRFATVTAAYAVLSDLKTRAKYDAGLALITDECSACKGCGTVYKQKGFGARVGATCTKCEGSGRVER